MKEINKAGCILINRNTNKICLVYREYLNDYSFPKGHIENDESLVECAIRETMEETKRIPIIDSNIKEVKTIYESMEGRVIVHYYVAYDAGKSNNKSIDTHPIYWFDYKDAISKISYESDKELLIDLNKKGIIK